MKVLLYCQHVLGIGHLYRSLAIADALAGHDVLLVTGGLPLDLRPPPHVREYRLPPLTMDADFSSLRTASGDLNTDCLKDDRRHRLAEVFATEKPDILLIELYPFGRKAFRFELDPLLSDIESSRLPPCPVICSVRDILVEKDQPEKHETRVVKTLNRWFDAILAHSDPEVVKLDASFGRIREIQAPIVYTGYIAPFGTTGLQTPDKARVRRAIGVPESARFVVVSAGGGKVGEPLLSAVLEAAADMNDCFFQVFTGPFLDSAIFERLQTRQQPHIRVERFTENFNHYLAAADLSVSMAGYNTCMNVLAAGTPALVWPFPQNREQGLRAAALAEKGFLAVLGPDDLLPGALCDCMRRMLTAPPEPAGDIRLDGATAVRTWLEQYIQPDPKGLPTV